MKSQRPGVRAKLYVHRHKGNHKRKIQNRDTRHRKEVEEMVEYQQTETADRNAGDKRQRRHRADKYKAESNRQAKERNKHIDTDTRVWWFQRRRGRREGEERRGGQIFGDWRGLGFAGSLQCNIQEVCYRAVHLKPL